MRQTTSSGNGWGDSDGSHAIGWCLPNRLAWSASKNGSSDANGVVAEEHGGPSSGRSAECPVRLSDDAPVLHDVVERSPMRCST